MVEVAKQNINMAYVVALSVVAALGGFLFGYDAAVVSGTVSQVAAQFALDELQVGWFVGCALIGSIVGVAFAGKLSDACGRKATLLVAALFFAVSGVGCAFSTTFPMLVVSRMLGGVGEQPSAGSSRVQAAKKPIAKKTPAAKKPSTR